VSHHLLASVAILLLTATVIPAEEPAANEPVRILAGPLSPPTVATGSDGQFYLSTVNGLIWGPKSAGAWPAAPLPASPGIARQAREVPAIPWDNSARADLVINETLNAVGHLELEPGLIQGSAKPDADFAQRFYRPSGPVMVPRYGSLIGRNSWFWALGPTWTTGAFSPMVCFKSDDGGIGPAQAMNLGIISGINVSGQYALGTDSSPLADGKRIIGISSGLRTTAQTAKTVGQPFPGGLYTLTHARSVLENSGATDCYYNFLLTMDQYSTRRNLKAGNGKVGFCHYQSYLGGGMVDMPEVSQLLCWGSANQIGHLFIFNRAIYPVHPYILRGSWAKGVSCAYAFVWNPLEKPSGFGQEVILDGGSTECNTAGAEGEAASIAVECLGRDDVSPIATFVHRVKKVELDIDRHIRVVARDYTFQDSDGLIGAYLRGPGSRLAIQHDTTFPEQVRYAVRAVDRDASTLFEHCAAPTGGIYENVRNWDMDLRTSIDSEGSNQAFVFSGWADPEYCAQAPSELHPVFADRVAPDFSGSAGGVTVATVADTGGAEPSGSKVTQLSFPAAKAAGERALTPFLGGGAKAKPYEKGAWRLSFVQLKNQHAAPVRVIPYIRNDAGFVRGANPATAGSPVEAAVTLWPDTWMVVGILWNQGSDGRLCIERLDTTTTPVTILASKLSDVRLPLTRRHALNRAMQRLIWK
jgi:hypothetical protein